MYQNITCLFWQFLTYPAAIRWKNRLMPESRTVTRRSEEQVRGTYVDRYVRRGSPNCSGQRYGIPRKTPRQSDQRNTLLIHVWTDDSDDTISTHFVRLYGTETALTSPGRLSSSWLHVVPATPVRMRNARVKGVNMGT